MKKFSKSEFAKIIRNKCPGSYDDLSDDKLIELWLKKYPGDKSKVNSSGLSSIISQDENIEKEISSYLLMWLGIVICILCAVGFFISSEWLITQSINTSNEYRNDDSNAGNFLYQIEIIMIDIAIWLKNLPVVAKIIGVIVGLILWFTNSNE
jgi:hypothetical protein